MADIRSKALKLLSQREHTRLELRRKLAGGEESREDLDALLDDFAARGWQSDARFAIAYVDANAARFGRFRLENELQQRGVAEPLIRAALAQLPSEDNELSRARTVWLKKFRQPASEPAERAKQARFLQTRGFSHDIIRRVITGWNEEDSND
ncbi:recombination regulator RecX [Chitinimonas arctica]|uniref:Regulatory protein RecX n=1 Tax=Chitinimonas arctica TaxID=2594795 RepID=A0A516SKD1_9NEIS|nr:recombination regulator RecX [Chitinimonas arctica]QDQ28615.1 recombination regulator RecX [Chitinimonas arctica]